MKKEEKSIFICLAGVIILCVFTFIATTNLLPDNSTSSYYSKNNSNGSTIIEKVEYINGKMSITTDNDDSLICIKQTKSVPQIDSLCWKQTNNNKLEVAVYYGKTYYIWLKDSNNLISTSIKYIAY